MCAVRSPARQCYSADVVHVEIVRARARQLGAAGVDAQVVVIRAAMPPDVDMYAHCCLAAVVVSGELGLADAVPEETALGKGAAWPLDVLPDRDRTRRELTPGAPSWPARHLTPLPPGQLEGDGGKASRTLLASTPGRQRPAGRRNRNSLKLNHCFKSLWECRSSRRSRTARHGARPPRAIRCERLKPLQRLPSGGLGGAVAGIGWGMCLPAGLRQSSAGPGGFPPIGK